MEAAIRKDGGIPKIPAETTGMLHGLPLLRISQAAGGPSFVSMPSQAQVFMPAHSTFTAPNPLPTIPTIPDLAMEPGKPISRGVWTTAIREP